jgi:hypothetical protein
LLKRDANGDGEFSMPSRTCSLTCEVTTSGTAGGREQ